MAGTLWRFESTVLKNKSTSDFAQVPAAATINFYRPGATASQVVTIPVTYIDPDPQPTVVPVYDSGTFAAGDTLLFDGEAAVLMTVAEVTSDTSVKLLNMTPTPIILGVGTRLINTAGPRPVAYRDVRGTIALGSSITTTAATGRAGCYLKDSPIDYVVSGTGLNARPFADIQGGPAPHWIDARMFSSIQAAIDALPAAGGVVYVTGTHVTHATIVIPKDKAVHLIGEGPAVSVISCPDPNRDILWVKGSYSTIENLTIKGPGIGGSGRGVVLGLLASDQPTDVLRRVSIIGCEVTMTASWALKFIDVDGPDKDPLHSLSIWSHIERTVFSLNQTAGLVEIGNGNTTAVFLNCAICHFRGVGLNGFGVRRLSLLDVTFEDKKDDVSPYLILDGVENALVSGPWFETHDASDLTQPFIHIGPAQPCRDVSVVSPKFVRHIGAYPRMIRVGASSKAVWVSNPTCTLNVQPAEDRFTTTDQSLKDINISDGCEVHISGGVINRGSIPQIPRPMAMSSPTRAAIVATGPRVGVPRVTSSERDDPDSLAFDRKPGDTIFNADLGQFQYWTGEQWLPTVAKPSGNSSQTGPLLVTGGTYRISAFVRLSQAPAPTVAIKVTWVESDPPITRTVTVIPDFGTANGIANGDAFIVASGPVSFLVECTPSINGSYSAEIHAERA